MRASTNRPRSRARAAHDVSKPLAALTRAQRTEALKEISQKLIDPWKQPAPSSASKIVVPKLSGISKQSDLAVTGNAVIWNPDRNVESSKAAPDVWLEGTFPGTFAVRATGHACEIRIGPIVQEAASIETLRVDGQIRPVMMPRYILEFPVISDLRDDRRDIAPSLYCQHPPSIGRSAWPEPGPAAAMKEFFRVAVLVRRREKGSEPDFSTLTATEIDAFVERQRQPFHFSFDITFWDAEHTEQRTRRELLVYEPARDEAFVRHSGKPMRSTRPSVG